MTAITSEQIKADVEAIVRRIRPTLKGPIADTDRLREDLGLDSLHSMELLSSITEKYEVDVDVEQVQEITTVGDVVSFLAEVLAPGESGK
jgi:acyl carrier protein